MTNTRNKRSLTIARHRTSVSLEEPFWAALADIAKHAHKRGSTLREEAARLGHVSEEDFDRLVRPEDMVAPKD